MKYKNLILSIIFIFVVIIVYFQWEKIIQIKRSEDHGQFFHEKNIDVVFVGTSRTWIAFSPMYIWGKYGVVSYNRASSGQSYKMSYYLMKDAVENHNAKVIVFEIGYLLKAWDPYVSVISNILNMLPLTERYSAYKELFGKDFEYDKLNVAGRFHTRWKELKKNDFTYEDYWKGFIGINNSPFLTYTGPIEIENNKKNLHSDVYKYAKLMVDYANSKGVKLIFINIPAFSIDHGYAEAFAELANKEGWVFFNYDKMVNEIGFDYTKDLADPNHTSLRGGKKLLSHLIPYITENYNIPNRKNDKEYAFWNDDFIKYSRAVNREEMRLLSDFNEWWNYANYDNYTMLISVKGENVLKRLSDNIRDKFKSIGLSKYETNNIDDTYAAIIDNNQVFYEYIYNKQLGMNGRVNNKFNMEIRSDKSNAIINISGKPRSKNKYGINFVIYDNVNREVVDSIWLDPKDFSKVNR